MQKTITKTLILAFVLTAALGVNYLFAAWTGPTQAPTGGNTSTPVHVGTTDQVKNGGLSLDGLSVFGGGYFQGNIGVNEVAPATGGEQDLKLDVEGAIGAKYYCDENGNNCVAGKALGGEGVGGAEWGLKWTGDQPSVANSWGTGLYALQTMGNYQGTTVVTEMGVDLLATGNYQNNWVIYTNDTFTPQHNVSKIWKWEGGGSGGGGIINQTTLGSDFSISADLIFRDVISSTINISGTKILASVTCGWKRTGGSYRAGLLQQLNLNNGVDIQSLPTLDAVTPGSATDISMVGGGAYLFTGLSSGIYTINYQVASDEIINLDIWSATASQCRIILEEK